MKNYININSAFLSLSKDENKLEKHYEFTIQLLNYLKTEKNLLFFLADEKILIEEKRTLLLEIFSNDNTYVNFLLVILEMKIIFDLQNLLNDLILAFNKEMNILNVIVWTTITLNDDLLNTIKSLVEKKYNQKTLLMNKLDSEMLGGIKLEVNNKLIDYSLKTNLINLYSNIIEQEINK